MPSEQNSSVVGGLAGEVIRWLGSLPSNAEVRWYSHDLDRDEPVATGWVDVLCTALQDEVACNWVWSVVAEVDGSDRVDPLTFVFQPDRCVFRTWDPGSRGVEPTSIAAPIEGTVTADQARTLNAALVHGSERACVIGSPGWTAGQVTKALQSWIARHCNRSDLLVVWEPDGPKASCTRDLEAMVEAHALGIEPTYLLDPGEAEGGEGITITASDQVMEFFLQELVHDDDTPSQ